MDFDEVINTARRFAGHKKAGDSYDDLLIDRLHNRYTVATLICFCIAVSTYQHLGKPLECWVPAQFTEEYEEYTNRLCYIQNTYHIAKHQLIPQDSNLRRERTLKYYQWINFILLLQAVLFRLPRFIWQSFNDRIGLSVGNLVEASDRCESFDNDQDRGKNERQNEQLPSFLNNYYIHPFKCDYSSYFKRFNHQFHLFCQARTGGFLACFYIFIKFLYIFNLIFQILFLQYFLSYSDISYLQYGIEIFGKLFSDGFSLPESRLFPRVTLCDFQIRELGERHYYTVECILSINIFIEKMYFILWIWFGILLLITIIDTIWLIYRIFFRHSRNIFITDSIDLIIKNHIMKEKEFPHFLHYFPIDNLFVLKIISSNSNSLIVAEVLYELFQRRLHHGSDV